MRTLVIGAGAVGGFLGARLAQAGFDVTLLARGEHGRALREHGLSLRGEGGEQRVQFARVALAPDELSGRFELVLLCVKWPALERACDPLPNLIAPAGVVAPFLNGLSSEDVVAHYVGAQRTIAAVAYMSAGVISPGVLYSHGHPRVGLAPYRPGQDAELAQIAALFARAGVPVQRSDDHPSMLWQKMVWNAPFSAICALTGKTAGACIETMEPLLRSAMCEVIAVARAEGITLPARLIDGILQHTRDEFALSEPSMLQDLRKGRPTEVEILQGEVVARGEQLGVQTPVLWTLAALLRGLGATLPGAPSPSP